MNEMTKSLNSMAAPIVMANEVNQNIAETLDSFKQVLDSMTTTQKDMIPVLNRISSPFEVKLVPVKPAVE